MIRPQTKALLVLVLFLWGCRDGGLFQSAHEVFVGQSSAVGVYLDGRQVLVYDQSTHQTARRGNSFRLQTDNQLVYLNLHFDPMPSSANPTTSCTISTRGIAGLEEGSYEFQRVEQREQKMWLWNEKQKMGLIISIE